MILARGYDCHCYRASSCRLGKSMWQEFWWWELVRELTVALPPLACVRIFGHFPRSCGGTQVWPWLVCLVILLGFSNYGDAGYTMHFWCYYVLLAMFCLKCPRFVMVCWVAGWLYKVVQCLILATHFTLLCVTENFFVFCWCTVSYKSVMTMSNSRSYLVTPVALQLYSSTPVAHHLLLSRSRSYTSTKYDPWSNPYTVLTTPHHLPCLDMSSPCTRYISYLVSFSPDLT